MRLLKMGGNSVLERVPALLGGHIAPTFDLAVGSVGAVVQGTEIILATDTDSNDGVVRLKDLAVFKRNNGISCAFVGHFFKAT